MDICTRFVLVFDISYNKEKYDATKGRGMTNPGIISQVRPFVCCGSLIYDSIRIRTGGQQVMNISITIIPPIFVGVLLFEVSRRTVS